MIVNYIKRKVGPSNDFKIKEISINNLKVTLFFNEVFRSNMFLNVTDINSKNEFIRKIKEADTLLLIKNKIKESFKLYQDLLKNVDCRYTLVVKTAKRARQLIDGAELLVDTKEKNPVSQAVDEILAGKISYIRKTDSGVK